ncbi:hypothetical protein [uncultured Roseibium sp.]|uniref:hypothetical protein n=1 Tax=uncultured Roseibium sp. TaxID=1936171 RepID=UPI003216E047
MAEQVRVTLEEHELVTNIKHNFEWGNADVFAVGRHDSIFRLGEIAGYLSMMGDKEGNPVISSVCVILPPSGGRCEHEMHEEIRNGIRQAFLRFEKDEKRVVQFVERTITDLQIFQASNFDQNTLIKLISREDKKQAIIIGEAALYRSQHVNLPEKDTHLSEDIWCAHLHHLMEISEKIALSSNNYILMDAGEEIPARTSNVDLLKSVGNVGLCGNILKEDIAPEDVISLVSEIQCLIDAGAVGKALSCIENEDSFTDLRKLYLRLMVYQQAGFQDKASDTLDEADEDISLLDSYNLIGIAKIAAEIGRDDFAQTLLQRALPELLRLTELEFALQIALKTHRQWLIETIRERIRALHPNSELLRSIDGRSAALAGEYKKASDLLCASASTKEQEIGELYHLLAEAIAGDAFSNPVELSRDLAHKEPEWADLIQREILQTLERAGRRDEAVALLFSGEITWDSEWFNFACGILERSLASGSQAVGSNLMLRFIGFAAAHIAAHPNDGNTRTTVADFFDAERTGLSGISALVLSALDRAMKPRGIEKEDPDWQQSDNIERLPNVMERVLVWLGAQNDGIVRMGHDTIPSEILGEDPDQILNGLRQMADYYACASNSPTDEHVLKHIATVALAIAPTAKNIDGDLEIVRFVAVQLIISGRSQIARDLAELVLTVAGSRSERRKKALVTFADIYARLHRSREALLLLIASLELPSDGTLIGFWTESTVLLRILRDTGLADESLRIIEHLRETLKDSNDSEFYHTRLGLLELHAQWLKYLAGGTDAWPMNRLLESAVTNAQAALSREDEALPISIMMRQLIHRAETDGLELLPEVYETLENLSSMLVGSHQTLMTAMDRLPNASAIAAVAGPIESARYNDDVSYDLRIARSMGSKLARASTREDDQEGFAYSVELLGAQGVGVHDNKSEVKVTCHGIFPPPSIRVRSNLRTDNEANTFHRRADHRHPGRARGRREVRGPVS